jgi:hypothetical protein
MPTTVTMEEIEAIINRTATLQAENAEGMKEMRATQAKTDAQMKADREQRETDWAKTVAQIKADREQWAAQLKISREATEKSFKLLHEELGGMGSSNGAYAEDYFANAMKEKKVFAGQHFDEMVTNLKAKAGGVQDEYDIVLYNGEAVGLIEIKYKARPDDLEKMVEKKVPNFRALFPYYKDYKVYLGLGSMSFNDRIYSKAEELGIGLLKQVGETVEAEPGYVKAY